MLATIVLDYNVPGVKVGTDDIADKLEMIAKWLRERSAWDDYSQNGQLLAYGDHGNVVGTFFFNQMAGKEAENEQPRYHRTEAECQAVVDELIAIFPSMYKDTLVVVPVPWKDGNLRYCMGTRKAV